MAVRSSRPVLDRARRLISGAYGVTYFVFVVGLLTGPSFDGAGPILLGVLTVTLDGAFLVSRWWTGRRRAAPSLAGLLLLPVILLGLVGGACYATTGAPFGLLGQPTADTFSQPAGNAPEQAPAIAPAYPAY